VRDRGLAAHDAVSRSTPHRIVCVIVRGSRGRGRSWSREDRDDEDEHAIRPATRRFHGIVDDDRPSIAPSSRAHRPRAIDHEESFCRIFVAAIPAV
jgi:hypothetical protein